MTKPIFHEKLTIVEKAQGANYQKNIPDGIAHSIGGKCQLDVQAGDRLRILTPGGGGFGL